VRACLQAFASGAGLAEYQICGDLSGINYSSIRAGLLEFRRKCEQYQHSVFILQICHPIYRRWLREAMLAMVFGIEPTPTTKTRSLSRRRSGSRLAGRGSIRKRI
jgi:capsid protein